MVKKPSSKKKLEIVFDAKKRTDFLTGFRKRKNERRSRAKAELEHNLKEERKRIRQQVKNGLKHMKKSFEPLKELTEQDKANEDEYEDNDVKVKIVELSTKELAAQNNLLGENCAPTSDASDAEQNDSDNEVDYTELDTVSFVPGMDLVRPKKKTTSDAQHSQHYPSKTANRNNSTNQKAVELTSKKEIDRLKKNKTLKQLKKSKVFKMKERLDNKANQKKIKRDKNNTLKSLPKNQRLKLKHKPTQTKYHKGRMVNKKQKRKKHE